MTLLGVLILEILEYKNAQSLICIIGTLFIVSGIIIFPFPKYDYIDKPSWSSIVTYL